MPCHQDVTPRQVADTDTRGGGRSSSYGGIRLDCSEERAPASTSVYIHRQLAGRLALFRGQGTKPARPPAASSSSIHPSPPVSRAPLAFPSLPISTSTPTRAPPRSTHPTTLRGTPKLSLCVVYPSPPAEKDARRRGRRRRRGQSGGCQYKQLFVGRIEERGKTRERRWQEEKKTEPPTKKKRLALATTSEILREDKIHPRQCKDDNEKKKRAHACLLDLTLLDFAC
ncbi:hypothetical protein HDK77DRAFT_231940 [Phyllosticta capitalensis]